MNSHIEPTKSQDLGNITKFASTGEDIPITVLRFFLQSSAREILPHERVSICLRTHAPNKQTVEIRKASAKGKAFYSGLVVCGSVWHCPICAARITEKRKQELEYAYNEWTGGVIMMTYTYAHTLGDNLEITLAALKESFRAMKSGRGWQEIIETYGWIGSVKSLEVTYGENGWHSHFHELVFLTNRLTGLMEGKLEFAIRKRWLEMLPKVGLHASFEHGAKLTTDNGEIQGYVAKFGEEIALTEGQMKNKHWTLVHEVTKTPAKRAKAGGRTPLQLLYDYWDGDMPSKRLWREYAMAFKGSHQLQWSKGMRLLMRMGLEIPDEKLAVVPTKDTILLASLDRDEWRAILTADMRGRVLHWANTLTQEEFAHELAAVIEHWKD